MVAPYIEQYAKAARLERATPQFRDDIAKAIRGCLVEQLHSPSRKRYGDIRKEIRGVSLAMVEAMNMLRGALDALTPAYREKLETYFPEIGAKTIARFDASAHLIGQIAEQMKDADKGGSPKWFAFDYLVSGLKKAYEHVSGKRPPLSLRADKSDDGKPYYDSPLIDLVEAVLPLVRKLAGEEPPLMVPETPEKRGSYIYNNYRPGAGKTKRPHPKV
jgi:hypothetical protein